MESELTRANMAGISCWYQANKTQSLYA